jgi:hypothetical protein
MYGMLILIHVYDLFRMFNAPKRGSGSRTGSSEEAACRSSQEAEWKCGEDKRVALIATSRSRW